MDNKQLEEIFNQTFAGLTFFYRDATLSENLISKYSVGQILTERGFTDMSTMGGGIASNFRYLIASAHAKNLSAFNPEMAQFGHVVLTSSSFFKVLDIYKIGEKTQILLLEIPSHTVDHFARATSNVEEEITKKGRASFDTKVNAAPIAELQKEEWKDRTKFPIGMSDAGELFYQSGKTTPPSVISKPAESMKKADNQNLQAKPWWKFW